jgi:hypothetical protein
MKMKKNAVVHCLLLALAGRAAAGTIAVATTPATADHSSRVSVTLKDVDEKALVDALSKAVGVPIECPPRQDPNARLALPQVYDFVVKDVSIEEALDRAGKLLSRQVTYDKARRVSQFREATPYGIEQWSQLVARGDEVKFSIRSISLMRTLGREGVGRARMQIYLGVTSVPWLESVTEPRFVADEVTADSGAALEAKLHPIGVATPGRFRYQPDGIEVTLPSPLPRAIKVLKGRFILPRVDARETLRAKGLSDGTVAEGDAWGCHFRFGPLAKEGDRYTLPVRIDRGEIDDAAWKGLNRSFMRDRRLASVAGADLGSGSGGGRQDKASYEGVIRYEPEATGVAATNSVPDMLVISRPAKTTEIEVPIEFNDVVIP